MRRRNIPICLIACVVLWAGLAYLPEDAWPAEGSANGGGPAAREAFLKRIGTEATLTFRTDFAVAAPPAVWNRILDHPLFMGKLWNIYGFQPPYRVVGTTAGVMVIDPTGIRGELVPIAASPSSRTFYGRGAIDHWAVPSFISAEGLFVFSYQDDGRQGLRGSFEVLLKGDNDVTDLLMKLAAGSLKRHIHNRFAKNIEDLKKIIADIRLHPDQLRLRLAGNLRKEFNSLF